MTAPVITAATVAESQGGAEAAAEVAAAAALIEAEDQVAEQMIEAAQTAIVGMLQEFDGWYDHGRITELVQNMTQILTSFKVTASRSSNSYMTQMINLLTGGIVLPTTVVKNEARGPRAAERRAERKRLAKEAELEAKIKKERTEVGTVFERQIQEKELEKLIEEDPEVERKRRLENGNRNIDMESSLGRIANVYRTQQADIDGALSRAVETGELPPDLVDPSEAANERARSIVRNDMMLSRRAQWRKTMIDNDVKNYRRVIHPELSKGGSCGLCVAASTRVYHVEGLLPLHDDCSCTQVPVIGPGDPGLALNEKAYITAEQLAGGTGRQVLAKTRFQVDEHGELGPVLRPEGEPIRSKTEVKRQTPLRKTPKSGETLSETLTNKRDKMLVEYRKMDSKLKNGDKDFQAAWTPVLDRMGDRIEKLNDQIKKAASLIAPIVPKPRPGERPELQKVARQILGTTTLTDYLKIEGSHSLLMDYRKTNPNFSQGGEWAMNCVHTVDAEELRRRGFDVVATPLPHEMWAQLGRDAGEALSRWLTPDGKPAEFAYTSKFGVLKRADALPPGGRGWVALTWKSNGAGHIFAVEKDAQGNLHWVDPQRGTELSSPDVYLNRAQNVLRFARVDNLTPTDAVTEFAREATSQERVINLRRVTGEAA